MNMLSTNIPATDAIAKIETTLNNLNQKYRYKMRPTIPVVARINNKLLSGEESA
jgi:hypothetical protein